MRYSIFNEDLGDEAALDRDARDIGALAIRMVVPVLLGLAVATGLTIQSMRDKLGKWEGEYCLDEGCPQGSDIVSRSGVIFKGDDPTCRPYFRLRSDIGLSRSITLKPGSCRVQLSTPQAVEPLLDQ